MELVVRDIQGKETSKKVSLNDTIFGAEPNNHALYLDVKLYLANQRQGTHKAKERGEISRTTKKHHRQKGTGGARYGSLRSPLHRGGGTVFGPRPRNYSFKLNKKLRRLARVSALSIKANSRDITVLENFDFDTPKTKNFSGILSSLGVSNKKSLMVLAESNNNVYLSSRNLQGVKVVSASDLNTYDILNAQNLILTEGAIEKIENALS